MVSARDTEAFKRGHMRANAYHWTVAGKKCTMCGKNAVMTARVFAPLDGLPKEHLIVMGLNHPGGQVPVVDTKSGKYVRIGEAAACALHRSDLERESAKHKDTWFVEFDYGPDAANATQIGGFRPPVSLT